MISLPSDWPVLGSNQRTVNNFLPMDGLSSSDIRNTLVILTKTNLCMLYISC